MTGRGRRDTSEARRWLSMLKRSGNPATSSIYADEGAANAVVPPHIIRTA